MNKKKPFKRSSLNDILYFIIISINFNLRFISQLEYLNVSFDL